MVHRIKMPPTEAAMAMRTVNVVFLAWELEALPCLSGTTVSEAATAEVRVTPGTMMVLTPSSVVEVIWGGGDEDTPTDDLELVDF
jgi:hypothetical protein